MCGITAIINKTRLSAASLIEANQIVRHRGPDDEGYLLWAPGQKLSVLAGSDTAPSTLVATQLPSIDPTGSFKVGLAHRRLSILDLSPAGHQPMLLEESGLAITYNGEVYNYLELRKELEQAGHRFHTGSDTEVMLHAWQQWGPNCLQRFNGMFAFVLLDARQQKLYAVRDRFGVKPLYYNDQSGYLAFVSEVKQLRLLPEYKFELNHHSAYDYLRYGSVDHNTETFEEGIHQLPAGGILEVDLPSGRQELRKWYTLHPQKWKGSFKEACEEFYRLLKDSVRLRMRSDVPVGSALSGGLDSSTIVCLMREVLQDQGVGEHPIKTVTSCQKDKRYDEWEYAETVIKRINAEPYKVFPTFEKLLEDLSRFLWHMDYPFGSTSQFSQWCVFEGAAQAGLTVMIDGQGADEQLAGYGGNDMALYTGLLSSGQFLELGREIAGYARQYRHWPTGFVLGAVQHHIPELLVGWFPQKYKVQKEYHPDWLRSKQNGKTRKWAGSLQENLHRQVTEAPLPSLLRYEDRNSMAFSIESRVPFMDYRLIEFTLGLPERFVYRRGERKYILRKAFQGLVSDKVLNRKDKMGFVSAEERWLKEEGKVWFQNMIQKASYPLPEMINSQRVIEHLNKIQKGLLPFNFDPWRIICMTSWIETVSSKKSSTKEF